MFWVIVPLLAGIAIAGAFWDEIREWYTEHLERWLA